jgi:ATP-dependent helicase/nuclease subunit A
VSAADWDVRRAAITESSRNVVIDAGAGTGKTSLLVERIIELVAPASDRPAVPIDRIAAITFTRRATGHLRLKLRERLLAELGGRELSPARQEQLFAALGGLDTAYVSTTHSFADRLLRLRPIEARLSPDFHIVEDDRAYGLVDETFEILLHAADTGTLGYWLAGTGLEDSAGEVERTFLDAIDADVLVVSNELEFMTQYGLSDLVRSFIDTRDQRPAVPDDVPFDLEQFRRVATDLVARIDELEAASSTGLRWMKRLARRLGQTQAIDDPVKLHQRLVKELESKPVDATKKRGFANEGGPHKLYKALSDGTGEPGGVAIRHRLLAPLRRWMAARLVRTFPAVVALYERVKASHQAVDQIDLLLKLRDVLATDLNARRFYQSLFDHILVDEFQDTDPLQAEVILYLCEDGAEARRWDEVRLAPGRLTIVGDPKQSIYRFRRADVAMYDQVRRQVLERDALDAELTTCFRSTEPLIEWGNERFAALLGTSPDAELFDAESGVVYHRPLAPHRGALDACPTVALRFGTDDETRLSANDVRALEGQAVAQYLRELVESGLTEIEDPNTGERRPVGYRDVAILSLETYTLRHLFPALDAADLPYAAVGGTLFLRDSLHQQFLLGLRALADRDDGVAAAALLRPPFFALDPADLLAARASERSTRADRANEALEWLREMRRTRFKRTPGQIARDLLEQTAFGRTVALGANGSQRLRRLRELCLVLEQTATARHLDFDGVTAALRGWVDSPIPLDPPIPTSGDAIRVMTIHQAKGLEFPIVYLWDARAQLKGRPDAGAWRIERNGSGWELGLHKFAWEEPEGIDLKSRELAYRHAERRRVIYVAATRARDRLIIPSFDDQKPRYISSLLLDEPGRELVTETQRYTPETAAPRPPRARELQYTADLQSDIETRWRDAVETSCRPNLQPTSVSELAKGDIDRGSSQRSSRHGPVFGDTVHLAVSLCLTRGIGAQEAVRRAVLATGLDRFVNEAISDTANALAALQDLGLPRRTGPTLRSEYPVFAASTDGAFLHVGTIDLLGLRDNTAIVIDFKSDQPPTTSVGSAYPQYVRQVGIYGSLVKRTLGLSSVQGSLIFTKAGRSFFINEQEIESSNA